VLTQTRQEQIKKMVQASEYQKQISELENQQNGLEQLSKRLESEKTEALRHNEQLRGALQEKEEQLRKRIAEYEALKEELLNKNKEIYTLSETATRMGIQLQNKVKEVLELKKEKESKMVLEAKLGLLQKELDQKNNENLQMSRTINNVLAEKEVLLMKTTNLEQQLENEHLEKENLQNSIVHLQQSKHFDFSSPSDIKNGHFGSSDPMIIPISSVSINPEDLPPEGRAFFVELEVLESMGHRDRAKNIELLNQYQDVVKVINHYKVDQKEPFSTPREKRVLPEGIAEHDIHMLETMGFSDLDHNIALLRQHKDVGAVLEVLIG